MEPAGAVEGEDWRSPLHLTVAPTLVQRQGKLTVPLRAVRAGANAIRVVRAVLKSIVGFRLE